MPWNGTTVRLSGFTVTAAVWNDEIVENLAFLEEVAYTEFTSDTTHTATSAATATQVVSSGAIVYEAVPHLIEFFSHRIQPSSAANAQMNLNLWDGSTDLGMIAMYINSAAVGAGVPCFGARRLTPTAASHTYRIMGWVSTGTGTVHAGTGTGGNDMPGFIRITRIPT